MYIITYSYNNISPFVGVYDNLDFAESKFARMAAEGRRATLRFVETDKYGNLDNKILRDTDGE